MLKYLYACVDKVECGTTHFCGQNETDGSDPSIQTVILSAKWVGATGPPENGNCLRAVLSTQF
jgi:hypothetical protein